MGRGLEEAGLPADAIQIVPTRDRAAVGMMLTGLDDDTVTKRIAELQLKLLDLLENRRTGDILEGTAAFSFL